MAQLDWALWLAARGFRVFPIIPWGKKPAIDSFQIAATTDPETIHRWWSQRPDYNIGVSTTGIVVVDVDTKQGREGDASYDMIGGHYNTFVAKTATGGYHCYFAGPDSMQAIGVMPGIDLRSHHGYVVGPGSVTSARYSDCVDGEYTVVNDAPMAEVPIGVKSFLKPPIHARQRNDNIELDKETSIAHAAIWAQNAEPAIEGNRNNTAYKVSAALVRDFALSPETAYQLLLMHWNHRNIPPMDHGELWASVIHAAEYGQGDAGSKLPETVFGEIREIEVPPAPAAPAAIDIGVRLGNAPDPINITARPWKVERLLMNGDVTVLAGMGAAGKSMLQVVLAAHWSQGLSCGPFRPRVPDMPLRIIMYNAEDDTMEQGRRLLSVCQVYNFDYNKVRQNIAFMDDRVMRICIAQTQQGVVVPIEPAIKFLVDTAQALKADVQMFDPMLNIHRCNENANGEMLDVIGILRHIARVTNTAILAAQHTGKGSIHKDKGDVDTIRGASAIVNSARVAVILSAMDKDDCKEYGVLEKDRLSYARVDNAKANYGPKTGKAIAWFKWEQTRLHTDDYLGVPMLTELKAMAAAAKNEMLAYVRDCIVEDGTGGVSINKAANYVMQHSEIYASKGSATIAINHITKMLEEGPKDVGEDRLYLHLTETGRRLISILKV